LTNEVRTKVADKGLKLLFWKDLIE